MGWYDCTCFLVSRRRKAVISAAKQQQPVASPPARSTTSCDPSPLLMERDFLGLNGDAAVALQVKERSRRFQDSSDSISILSVNPAVQWPYANETAAQLQAQSPNAADDCKLKRKTFDHFSFPGLHINPKCFPVVSSQTLSNLGRQGLKQHLTSSAATIASDCPLVSHYSTPLAGSGGATAAEDHSVRSTFLGDRSSWNASKSFSSPSQLTIFYGGSVIVYDNVSSDMAREIMLLASSRNHAAAASTPVSLSPATTNSPRAIPLSRKASLARFVEKRKQRVINYKPYPFYDKRRDANSSAAVTLAIHENSDSDSGPSSHGSQ